MWRLEIEVGEFWGGIFLGEKADILGT